jgi:chromosome partitioning protein
MTTIIGVFSQKGGSGKTTIALHGAVQAAETQRVFLADADAQKSVVDWARDRRVDTPVVSQVDSTTIAAELQAARRAGMDLVIVDCPPHATARTAKLIEAIDFFVVPCKPTPVDLRTIPSTVALLEGKPFFFVLNEARDQSKVKMLAALTALATWGPVCPVTIPRLDVYADALIDGLAVTEYAPGSKAADRIRAAWAWIFKQVKQQQGATA